MSWRLNIDDVKRNIARLRLSAPSAIARSVNRGAVAARTQLQRDVAAEMKLKVGDVKRRLRQTDATAGNPTAVIDASIVKVPLPEFGARGPIPSRGRGAGVTTRIGRFPHAFMGRTRQGKPAVFERRGKARLPIAQLRGPSVADVAAKHTSAALERGVDMVLNRLRHEFQRLLNSGR